MVRLRGQLICMTEDEARLVRSHRSAHILAGHSAPGCLQIEVGDTDDPIIFELMEAFRDRAAFDAHQARTRDSAWFAATRGILRDIRLEEIGD